MTNISHRSSFSNATDSTRNKLIYRGNSDKVPTPRNKDKETCVYTVALWEMRQGGEGDQVIDPSIAKNLSFISKKNLMVDIPLKLRLFSYLRVSCSIIQRIDFNGLDINLLEKDKQNYQYSNLYRQLSCFNSQWWNTCQFSKEGSVISNNEAIATLLHPLYQLNLMFMEN